MWLAVDGHCVSMLGSNALEPFGGSLSNLLPARLPSGAEAQHRFELCTLHCLVVFTACVMPIKVAEAHLLDV